MTFATVVMVRRILGTTIEARITRGDKAAMLTSFTFAAEDAAVRIAALVELFPFAASSSIFARASLSDYLCQVCGLIARGTVVCCRLEEDYC